MEKEIALFVCQENYTQFLNLLVMWPEHYTPFFELIGNVTPYLSIKGFKVPSMVLLLLLFYIKFEIIIWKKKSCTLK